MSDSKKYVDVAGERQSRLNLYREEIGRCNKKIAEATHDFICSVRNAPEKTLELYLTRARAFTALVDVELNQSVYAESTKLWAEDLLVKWPEPLTPRELAEERIGEMKDHEQETFDSMWDNGKGMYAESVISLARAVDKAVLGKVHEFCNHQQ